MLTWSKKTMAGLRNKFKRDSSAPTLEITENDIVVFVVGPTGSGKSWFTKEVTESSLIKVSRHQHPHTDHIQAIRCEPTDEAKRDIQGVENIVFVDTPAFLTHHGGFDAQQVFKAWFNETVYKPRDVRVIYMHRVETDPALEPIKDHLQEFYNVPQVRTTRLTRRLHVVISHDVDASPMADSRIEKHTAELRAQVERLPRSKWQPSIHAERFRGGSEVAWKAVEELFRN